MICDWRPEWNDLGEEEQARLRARQGVGNMISCRHGWSTAPADVPADGAPSARSRCAATT